MIFCCYVDDVRIIGRSNEDCWATIRRVMSVAQMLGMQDAARKRRKLSKGGNPWAGSIVNTSAQEITVCVTGRIFYNTTTIRINVEQITDIKRCIQLLRFKMTIVPMELLSQ